MAATDGGKCDIEPGAPPHQTTAHASFGPGDRYLVWKRMYNHYKKERSAVGGNQDFETSQETSSAPTLCVLQRCLDMRKCDKCGEDKNVLSAIDASSLNTFLFFVRRRT